MVDIITLLKLRKGSIAILLFFSLSAFIFVHPIFNEFDNWGIHDWDHHIMEHAVERDSIVKHRQWPLWNPYKGGGFPALGHPRSICSSPLFILVLIWGPVVGVKLMALSCMVIGLVGTFKLAREWRISTSGAYLAAFVFMFNSSFPLKIAEGTTIYYGQCWVPWMLFFVSRLLHRPLQWIRYSIGAALSFSLVLLQGGGNDPVFNFILLSLFLIIATVQHRQLRAVAGWGLITVLIVILSAVKLLPVMETSRSMWRLTTPDEMQANTLSVMPAAFLGRDQRLDSPAREERLQDPNIWNWEEYGCYFGWGSVVLAVIGLITWRQKRLVLGILLVFFAFLYLGHLAPVDLWYWIHKLPVCRSLHLPSRCGYCIAFIIALLAGYGLTAVESSFRKKFKTKKLFSILIAIIPVLILIDLGCVSWPILGKIYIHPPKRVIKGRFIQHARPVADRTHRDYEPGSLFYPKYLQNIGEIDGETNLSVTRNAVPAKSPLYKGEWYLLENAPSDYCRLQRFTPNAIWLDVFSEKENRVVLNQNYFYGWRVAGLPDARTEMYRGKISVPIIPGYHKLKIYYWPRTFGWGLSITVLALVLCAAYLIRDFQKRWFVLAAISLFIVFIVYSLAGIQVRPEIKLARRALDNDFHGDQDKLLDNLRAAVIHYPDSAELRELLRFNLLKRWEEGDSRALEEMIGDLKELIRLRPENPANYTNLGVAYIEKGAREQATGLFNKALRLKPGYGPALEGLKKLRK